MWAAYESSDGNKDSIGNWTEVIHVIFWQKNLSTFLLCPETLWEAEFKGSNTLI
jgi:hypothetical protein